MTKKPTFMSLFSGIGGFDLGLERAGFECIAQCDNDPFCNKVLAKHWPGVKRYDDVRNIWGVKRDNPYLDVYIPGMAQPVDLICGGFPCQDLSVAGKRAGLDGARSGLWFEFHRILSELRPTFCLIENVPGLLSSNSGRDFGIVLGGLGELGYAVGWCVLDSQHFGVPQRRRRVYIIGGPSRASVQQILSLCESGDWNTQTRRTEREDVAATIRGRSSGPGVNEPGRGGEDDANLVLAAPLLTHIRHNAGDETYIPDMAYSLQARDGKGVSQREGVSTLVAHSLRADGFDASEDGTGRGTPLVPVGFTIHGTDKTARVASYTDLAGSLRTKPPGTQENSSTTAVHERMGVRRLTPVEAERLQGFPDDFTKLDDRTPDGPRYKALGNAVTVSVIEYIGLRIREVLP